MKTVKNKYIIQDPDGELVLMTLRHERKTCIANFLIGSAMTWKEVQRIGWKCLKVNVNFEIL
ncbi:MULTISPECIES: hypothetical protein [unclassified Chryseobacterium]|uniref:hypothetical protein n=1 Tax=unclassified Chryseobacterium TaxID=2593645 RepID=UPI0028535EAF|nr:hypothetical protein [Chryseobacterium sp. CFS7]MDR4892257.1 hypothetical protein [Chryseobacterium sp. CFS7]